MQEARHAELRLEEEAAKLEFELTESQSSLAYVTTKLHATEGGRNELERKLQEAHQKLKASDAAVAHLRDQASLFRMSTRRILKDYCEESRIQAEACHIFLDPLTAM